MFLVPKLPTSYKNYSDGQQFNQYQQIDQSPLT